MERGPEWIIWLVTGRCNLNCKHCYSTIYREEVEMKTDDIKKVLNEAAIINVEHINFTGGEVLLRKDLLEILLYAKDLGIDTSIFTNSTLLSQRIISSLLRLDTYVYTSLDGATRYTHDSIRGIGVWERTLRGLKALKKAGVEYHVNIAVTTLNWREVGRIVEKAYELGASNVSLIPTMPIGNALKHRIYIDAEKYAIAIREAAQIAEERGYTVGLWCTPFSKAVIDSERIYFGNCRIWNVMDISPSGRVLLCDVLNMTTAHIRNGGLLKAWIKHRRSKLYNEALKVYEGPPCNTCTLQRYCKGGCYARAYITWGSFNNPDPLCINVKRSGKVQSVYY